MGNLATTSNVEIVTETHLLKSHVVIWAIMNGYERMARDSTASVQIVGAVPFTSLIHNMGTSWIKLAKLQSWAKKGTELFPRAKTKKDIQPNYR